MMLPINKKEFYAIEDKKRIQQLLKRTREKKQCKDKETMRTQIKEIVTGARVKKKEPNSKKLLSQNLYYRFRREEKKKTRSPHEIRRKTEQGTGTSPTGE